MTQSQASANAGQEPLGVSVQTANQASGASLTAAPVSVTATQTTVTHAQESASAVGTTQQDTSVSDVLRGSLETQCLAQGSTVVPAPVQVTQAQIISTGSPVRQTTPPTRSSAAVNRDTLAHAVTSVPLVTMATQGNRVVNVDHASVMTTLTLRTLGHVTPQLASVSNACTTLLVRPVISVNMVTMAALWPTTADVAPV